MTLRAVPTPGGFVEGQTTTQPGQFYFDSLADAFGPSDFQGLSELPSTATLAEVIDAYNALLAILKG